MWHCSRLHAVESEHSGGTGRRNPRRLDVLITQLHSSPLQTLGPVLLPVHQPPNSERFQNFWQVRCYGVADHITPFG